MQVLLTTHDSGIALMGDTESRNISAMVNGKMYTIPGYRPINGDGRQLRENTISAINEMLPTATALLMQLVESMNQPRVERQDAEKCREAEKPQKQDGFGGMLENAVLSAIANCATDKILEGVKPKLDEFIKTAYGPLPTVHNIVLPEKPVYETTEILHSQFDNIVSMLLCGESVYLYGPAGTGKSYIAQQIAKTLDIPFYCNNAVTDDITLKGFIDANGHYQETEFYRAFVNGGVFLLDELDASIPEVLVILNNALANGVFPFPNGKATMHENFHCIAAGNTIGNGADSLYTGRYQLDGASMDRFSFIEVNYDSRIEESLAMGDSQLIEFAHVYREAVKKCGINTIFTYRTIKRMAKFVSFMEKENAITAGLLKGMEKDDIKTVAGNLPETVGNEWVRAFRKLGH